MRELVLVPNPPTPAKLGNSGISLEGHTLVVRSGAGRVEHALGEVDAVSLSRRQTSRPLDLALWVVPALCLVPALFSLGPVTIAAIATGVLAAVLLARRPRYELVVRVGGMRHRYPVQEDADQAEAFAFECAGIVGGGLGAPGAYQQELKRIADYQLEVGKGR